MEEIIKKEGKKYRRRKEMCSPKSRKVMERERHLLYISEFYID